MEEGANELPEEEYGQSMRRVLDILEQRYGGISKLLDIELHLREGKSDLVIRTDRQLNESSVVWPTLFCVNSYCFHPFAARRCRRHMHWPIDELGTLHQNNEENL